MELGNGDGFVLDFLGEGFGQLLVRDILSNPRGMAEPGTHQQIIFFIIVQIHIQWIEHRVLGLWLPLRGTQRCGKQWYRVRRIIDDSLFCTLSISHKHSDTSGADHPPRGA